MVDETEVFGCPNNPVRIILEYDGKGGSSSNDSGSLSGAGVTFSDVPYESGGYTDAYEGGRGGSDGSSSDKRPDAKKRSAKDGSGPAGRWSRNPSKKEVGSLNSALNTLKTDAVDTPGISSEFKSIIKRTKFFYRKGAYGEWGWNHHDGTVTFTQAMFNLDGSLDLATIVDTFFHEVQHSVPGHSGPQSHTPRFRELYRRERDIFNTFWDGVWE